MTMMDSRAVVGDGIVRGAVGRVAGHRPEFLIAAVPTAHAEPAQAAWEQRSRWLADPKRHRFEWSSSAAGGTGTRTPPRDLIVGVRRRLGGRNSRPMTSTAGAVRLSAERAGGIYISYIAIPFGGLWATGQGVGAPFSTCAIRMTARPLTVLWSFGVTAGSTDVPPR
jgi:hypothetical protein